MLKESRRHLVILINETSYSSISVNICFVIETIKVKYIYAASRYALISCKYELVY